MVRVLAALVSLVVVGGCASQARLSTACVETAVAGELNEATAAPPAADDACTPARASRALAIGSVQTTSHQRRIVGVPTGFLLAMIVVILLVGAL